jgi:hypothetical protein
MAIFAEIACQELSTYLSKEIISAEFDGFTIDL